ncbi:putative leader peptide [Geodermatophilus sp. DSM 45219]|uniref:putative leader peptide n=1 Tax=Geodermatophilus sp. DSM 45219 TaxID=1881103 RepID=UPI00350F769C
MAVARASDPSNASSRRGTRPEPAPCHVPSMGSQPGRDTGHPWSAEPRTPATVISMFPVGLVRIALVERRHVDLLRCASALCRA